MPVVATCVSAGLAWMIYHQGAQLPLALGLALAPLVWWLQEHLDTVCREGVVLLASAALAIWVQRLAGFEIAIVPFEPTESPFALSAGCAGMLVAGLMRWPWRQGPGGDDDAFLQGPTVALLLCAWITAIASLIPYLLMPQLYLLAGGGLATAGYTAWQCARPQSDGPEVIPRRVLMALASLCSALSVLPFFIFFFFW